MAKKPKEMLLIELAPGFMRRLERYAANQARTVEEQATWLLEGAIGHWAGVGEGVGLHDKLDKILRAVEARTAAASPAAQLTSLSQAVGKLITEVKYRDDSHIANLKDLITQMAGTVGDRMFIINMLYAAQDPVMPTADECNIDNYAMQQPLLDLHSAMQLLDPTILMRSNNTGIIRPARRWRGSVRNRGGVQLCKGPGDTWAIYAVGEGMLFTEWVVKV